MTRHFPITIETPVEVLASRHMVTVYPDEPATSVRRHMRTYKARIALVIDKNGRLLGIITRGDVLIISSRKSNAKAKDIMENPTVVIKTGTKVGDAVKLMLKYDEWYVPVVKDRIVEAVFGLEHAIQRMVDENPDYLQSVSIADIMTEDVEVVKAEDYVSSVWDKMIERRYAGFPVVDDKGRLVGIVTQYDILTKAGSIARETVGGPSKGDRINYVMTRSVEFLTPENTALDAARLIANRGYGRIPIVEDKKSRKLVGIIDREDIVKLLFK